MTKESVLSTLQRAKAGDAQAMQELKDWQRTQRETARRVEELRLRLLQLTEKNWEQSISIVKNWLTRE